MNWVITAAALILGCCLATLLCSVVDLLVDGQIQKKSRPEDVPAPDNVTTRFEIHQSDGTIVVHNIVTTREVAQEMAAVNRLSRRLTVEQTLHVAERRIQERAK